MPSSQKEHEPSDEDVMRALQAGSDVLGEIVARYEERLRRYLRRLVPGLLNEYDDILQEVFIKVYSNAQSFDPSLPFSSWVYRITHNEAVSALRKHVRRADDVFLGDDDWVLFHSALEREEEDRVVYLDHDAVRRVLASLREKEREILILRYLEGREYKEISDILQIPEGTVATNIHRAKKAFSTKFHDHGGDEV